MFRPKNAGKQAAGILASSPQLMQTVQKRNLGGINARTPLPDPVIQGLIAQKQIERKQRELANSLGGSTPTSQGFKLFPGAPPQKGPGGTILNLFRPLPQFRSEPDAPESLAEGVPGIVPPKDFTALQGIGSVIPGRAFEGTDSAELGFEDADDDSTLLPVTADVLSNKLMSEELQGKAVTASGDQSQNDKDTRKKKVLPPESQDTSTSANIIKKLQENLDAATKGNKPPNKINPDQAVTEDPVNMAALVVTDRVNPEEVDLEKITKEATEILGIEPGKLDKRRKDAFYFNLMKAGLAIAAGGDSNALTNIAKGLSFGVNEYGKDISALNEEEAENRKEFANLKYRMIKDQETANIAAATATNQWNQNRDQIQNNYNLADYNAKIAQNERERQRLIEDRDYQLRLNDQAHVKATLEANTLFQIGKLQQGDEQLRQKERELTNAEVQQIITNNLAFLQTQEPVVKILEANGDLEIVDGKMTLTEQGKENRVQEILTSAALIEAAGASTKGKATDTTNLAQSISNVYNIDLDEAVILANQIGSDVTLQDAYKDLTGKELPPRSVQNQQSVTEDGFGSEVSVN